MRGIFLSTLTLWFVFHFFHQPPIPQRASYHDFADQRSWAGIPHAMDVLSNLPFLLVGLVGAWFTLRPASSNRFMDPLEKWPYAAMFVSVALVGLGSGYYHWAPDNASLTFDRLPMAVGFMALFSAMIAERVDPKAGCYSLVPLMLAGVGSVLYWYFTEQAGAGDLRPYFLVQTYAICAIPIILLLFPAKYDRGWEMLIPVFLYGLAKVAEKNDRELYLLTGFLSGHTLKHLLAAFSIFWILLILLRRKIGYNSREIARN